MSRAPSASMPRRRNQYPARRPHLALVADDRQLSLSFSQPPIITVDLESSDPNEVKSDDIVRLTVEFDSHIPPMIRGIITTLLNSAVTNPQNSDLNPRISISRSQISALLEKLIDNLSERGVSVNLDNSSIRFVPGPQEKARESTGYRA